MNDMERRRLMEGSFSDVEIPTFRDFDHFAAARGLGSLHSQLDDSWHGEPGRMSTAARDRLLRRERQTQTAWTEKRDRLRSEFDRLLSEGTIRLMTRTEALQDAARGHPDNRSTQAARRILTKQGIPW